MSNLHQIPQQPLVSDLACENAVLGAILITDGLIFEVQHLLSDDCFYNERNKIYWQAIKSVVEDGSSPDYINLYAQLKSQGYDIDVQEILKLTHDIVVSEIDKKCMRLHDLSVRRKLWEIGQRLITAGESEVDDIDEVKQMAVSGMDDMLEESSGVTTLTQAFVELSENMQRNKQTGTSTTGSPTGFWEIDKRGGFQKTDLIIIAGETSQGKTALSLSIVGNMIHKNEKIAYYSMEMTKLQLSARILSAKSGVPSNDILFNGMLSTTTLLMLESVKQSINSDNLVFDDRSTSSLDTILVSIRAMKLQHDINGAIVDYLQILNVNMKNYNKSAAMAEAARKFKNLAKDLGIWIIAISQLNRDSSDPVPNLNRLRDSGEIAEAADIVMFVYRPEYYGREFTGKFEDVDPSGKALIDVAKGRNVGVFQFLASFNKTTTYFSDLREINESKEDNEELLNQTVEDAPF